MVSNALFHETLQLMQDRDLEKKKDRRRSLYFHKNMKFHLEDDKNIVVLS